MKSHLFIGAALLALAGCATEADLAANAPPTPLPVSTAPEEFSTPDKVVRTNYGVANSWLCRPGLASNPCEVNIDATIVKADGSTSIETFKGDPNAPIDCFYVYPTVSRDPYAVSDLKPDAAEFNVVQSQLARFGSKCRLYAPMYRQVTLGSLRANRGQGDAPPPRGNRADGTNDVNDAWQYYLEHDNKGRGVVILGHSQGSGQITRLISSMIDGKDTQKLLVSAIIMGTAVQKAPGADMGGSFKSIPVCKTPGQVGCVISYSTYRDNVPPSATASFGINRQGTEAVCTNPAALGGGKATNPKSYWSAGNKEWVKGKKITTPFVMTPGLITTECVKDGNHTYLHVHINADPADARIDDPLTDVMAQGKPDPSWGLHLVDANTGMGDLVDIVGEQAKTWKRSHR